MHVKESTSTSSSDSELDIATARQVYYQERGQVLASFPDLPRFLFFGLRSV